MKVERMENPMFSDLRLPCIFVDSIMQNLSGNAVKLFLCLLVVLKRGEAVDHQTLATRAGLTESDLSVAIGELQRDGILRVTSGGNILLTDLKDIALQKEYRRRTSKDLEDSVERIAQNERQSQLIQDISNAFFGGMMPPGWYQEIDQWFQNYHFDPEVIYALFAECYNRGKLTARSYVRTVAADWASRGIRTYVDLSRDQEKSSLVGRVGQRVGKALNRKMTEHDLNLVRKWVIDFGFSPEMIEEVFPMLSGISNPNLNYMDKVLTTWHENNVQTPAEAKAFEENRVAALQAKNVVKRNYGKSDNVGNFTQREYSKDEYERVFVDIMAETSSVPDSTKNTPEQ